MDDLSKFLAMRLAATILIGTGIGYMSWIYLNQTYALLASGISALIGLTVTYMNYTKLPSPDPQPLTPPTMNNGGMLDDTQLYELRERERQLIAREPEVIPKKEDEETFEIDVTKPITEVAQNLGTRLYVQALMNSKVDQKTVLVQGPDGKMKLQKLIIKFTTKADTPKPNQTPIQTQESGRDRELV